MGSEEHFAFGVISLPLSSHFSQFSNIFPGPRWWRKQELFSRFATSTLVSLSAQNLTTSNCKAFRKNKNHSANSSLLPSSQSQSFQEFGEKSYFSFLHTTFLDTFSIYINICIAKFLYLPNLCWIQLKRMKFCFSSKISPNVWLYGKGRFWYTMIRIFFCFSILKHTFVNFNTFEFKLVLIPDSHVSETFKLILIEKKIILNFLFFFHICHSFLFTVSRGIITTLNFLMPHAEGKRVTQPGKHYDQSRPKALLHKIHIRHEAGERRYEISMNEHQRIFYSKI